MKIDTYKCDVCGTIKGENNHWFRIDLGASGLQLNAWGRGAGNGHLHGSLL